MSVSRLQNTKLYTLNDLIVWYVNYKAVFKSNKTHKKEKEKEKEKRNPPKYI